MIGVTRDMATMIRYQSPHQRDVTLTKTKQDNPFIGKSTWWRRLVGAGKCGDWSGTMLL